MLPVFGGNRPNGDLRVILGTGGLREKGLG